MFGRITPTVRNILIVNVAIYFLGSLLRLNLNEFLSLRSLHSEHFMPFQFFTYMFLHGDHWHLFFNMFGIFIFGPLLEQFWGPKRFLIFYIVTGIGAGVLYSGINYMETNSLIKAVEKYNEDPSPGEFKYILEKKANLPINAELNTFIYDYSDHADEESYIMQSRQFLQQIVYYKSNSQMVGASGALFGIILAFGVLFPNTVLMLIFPPIPIKAKYLVAIYGLFAIFGSIQKAPGDNVAHYAHLSGMLVGYILLKFWQKDRKNFF